MTEDLVRRADPREIAQTFQAEQSARWLTLTLGRYLQRAPYTDTSGYSETVTESNPDTYLWGRGVWLVAAAAARSIRENGHPLALSGAQGGKFENLPARPFPRAVNVSRTMSYGLSTAKPPMRARTSNSVKPPKSGAIRGWTGTKVPSLVRASPHDSR